MMNDYLIGAFRGRKLIQRHGTVGGAKSVFVKLQGIKNELVYPTFGGQIMNPFKGAAKMFAGDLCEYRTNAEGVKPEIYLLKTFLVKSVSGTTVNIVKDAYKHTPFVGDKIGVAPSQVGGAISKVVTVNAVTTAKVGNIDVWALTVSEALTATDGDVLVEADSDNNMLVKEINGVIDADIDTTLQEEMLYFSRYEVMRRYITEKYPDVEVEINNGGQPIYYYVISVE